jgi:hypothetical protein
MKIHSLGIFFLSQLIWVNESFVQVSRLIRRELLVLWFKQLQPGIVADIVIKPRTPNTFEDKTPDEKSEHPVMGINALERVMSFWGDYGCSLIRYLKIGHNVLSVNEQLSRVGRVLHSFARKFTSLRKLVIETDCHWIHTKLA